MLGGGMTVARVVAAALLAFLVGWLVGRAVPAAEIDSAVLQEQLQDAIARPATTTESLEVRDRLITKARAQLRVSRKASAV